MHPLLKILWQFNCDGPSAPELKFKKSNVNAFLSCTVFFLGGGGGGWEVEQTISHQTEGGITLLINVVPLIWKV